MDDQLQLSVVVPTHNTRELVLACLASLVSSQHPSTEIILVDDGGSDDTARVVSERHPAVRILRRRAAGGFAAAANHGLAHARGDILLILNSDTEVPSGSLHQLAAAFAARDRLGIAGAELLYPDGSPQWSGGRWPSTRWLFALASGLPALLGRAPGYRALKPVGVAPRRSPDWVCGAALAIRRQAWLDAGPFDESFAFYCQDLDLCRNAHRAGWLVDYAPGFRVVHHHGATISARGSSLGQSDPSLQWTDTVRFVLKHDGAAAAASARRAMLAGVRLRLAARALVSPLLARRDPRAWQHGAAVLRNAVGALQGMKIER